MAQVSRNKAARKLLVACLVALVPLAARALWWLPAFQERRVAKLSVTELAALTRREPENVAALLAYGRQLNQLGRYADALSPLQSAAGQDPDDGRVREAWFVAQAAGGYFTGAFGQLTQFVRTHPSNPDGRRALGRFYTMQRSYNRAVEELTEATRLAPQDPEAWSLLAAARRGLGELEPAREAIQTAVKLRPESAVDTLLAASLALETNRSAEAMALFARAATLAPGDSIVAQEWAKALLQAGRPEGIAQAQELAQRAATTAPSDPMALALLGKVQLAAGKPEVALPTLRKAAMLLPQGTPVSTLPANEPTQFLDPGPALEAAQAALALKQDEEAKRWRQVYLRRMELRNEWQQLIDLVRRSPSRETFQKMAELLARRGDAAEVAKYLAQARGSAGDAPPTLVATANLLRQEGYAEQAVGVARRAVLLAPRGPDSHNALGEAQLAAGRGHEAAVAFAHATGFMPTREAAYKAKLEAFYRRRAQNPTEAQRLYGQALALEQRTAELSPETLEKLLTQARALEPQNTDILRALLRVLYRRERWDEALQVADQLLTITPEDALGLALRATILLEKPGSKPELELLNRDLARALKEERLAPVYYAQGVLTLRKGSPKEALPILLQALELAREEKTYTRLSEAYQALGDTVNAAAMQQARQQLLKK